MEQYPLFRSGIAVLLLIIAAAISVYLCARAIRKLERLEDKARDLIDEIEQLKDDRQSMIRSLDAMEKEQDRLVEYNAALELQGDKLVDAVNKACKEAGVK